MIPTQPRPEPPAAPLATRRNRRKRPPVAMVAAAFLVVAGAGALVWSTTLGTDTTIKLIGGNLPINPQATDPLVVTAENSPALTVNPKNRANMVVANRIDRPQFACGLQFSQDGGATWRQSIIHPGAETVIPCFAPDAAFGADGVLHVSFMSLENVSGQGTMPTAAWVASSTDGGQTIGSAVKAATANAFQLRMAADSRMPGRLYLTWVEAKDTSSYGFAAPGNPVMMSRSDDGGSTWAAPVRVSPPARGRVVGPVPVTGPDTTLYVAYLDVGDDKLDYEGAHEGRGGPAYAGTWSLLVARSDDRGATWQESVVDAKVAAGQRFVQLFPVSPSVAVDGRGVYVGLADARLGDSDVWVWRSTNGGVTWDGSTRVNDTRRADGTTQYQPALATAADGRLDVIYYDRRADRGDVMNEVSLQSSFDGGKTFSRRMRLSDRAFDSRVGFGSDRELADLGTRLALLSTKTGTLAVWCDTRNAAAVIQKQLLARQVVSISRQAPGARAPLRIGGLIAIALGLVVAGLVVWSRRHDVATAAPASEE